MVLSNIYSYLEARFIFLKKKLFQLLILSLFRLQFRNNKNLLLAQVEETDTDTKNCYQMMTETSQTELFLVAS